MILNLSTIITFRSSSQLKRKTCHYLIYIQSIIDLGVGLVVTLLFSTVTLTQIMHNVSCEVYIIFLKVFLMTNGFSIAILSAMNFERYTSIVHPVFHRNKLTSKKLSVYVAVVSSLFIVVTIATFLFGQNLMVNFTGFISVLHLLSTVFFYVNIFRVGNAQLKRSNNKNHRSADLNERKNESHQNNTRNDKENKERCSIRQPDVTYFTHNTHKNGNNPTRKDRLDHHSNTPSVLSEINSNENGREDDNKRSGDQAWGLSFNTDEQNPVEHNSNHLEQSSTNPEHQDNRANDEFQDNVSHINKELNNLKSNENFVRRKSKQELLNNLKLAKSCLLVVLFSFISYLPPPIFSQVNLRGYDSIVTASWCIQLFILNATVDSLIFFWRNKLLRNEAKRL